VIWTGDGIYGILRRLTLAITRPQGAWADRNKPSEAALVHGGVR
jgi:hypothetical protein